jgi:hypothetical protein
MLYDIENVASKHYFLKFDVCCANMIEERSLAYHKARTYIWRHLMASRVSQIYSKTLDEDWCRRQWSHNHLLDWRDRLPRDMRWERESDYPQDPLDACLRSDFYRAMFIRDKPFLERTYTLYFSPQHQKRALEYQKNPRSANTLCSDAADCALRVSVDCLRSAMMSGNVLNGIFFQQPGRVTFPRVPNMVCVAQRYAAHSSPSQLTL